MAQSPLPSNSISEITNNSDDSIEFDADESVNAPERTSVINGKLPVARNRTLNSKARKLRVTTFLDRDVVMWLKVRALAQRMGYQTLLNRFLRSAIDRENREGKGREPVTRHELQDLMERLRSIEDRLQSKDHKSKDHTGKDPSAKDHKLAETVGSKRPAARRALSARAKSSRTATRTSTRGKASALTTASANAATNAASNSTAKNSASKSSSSRSARGAQKRRRR